MSNSKPVAAVKAVRNTRWRSMVDIIGVLTLYSVLGYVIYSSAQSLGYNWQWYRISDFIFRNIDGEIYPGPLLKGLYITLEITFYSSILALLIGLFTAILRLSDSWAGHAVATLYLELVRNTPLLVQMFVFYFVFGPILGIDRFWIGVICLAFFEGAFASEVIRGGILSVSKGQWEGAKSIGLTVFSSYRYIILPQALPIMLPPLTSILINLIKNSSIVSVIAIFDLTTEGRNLIADTFMSFEIWITVAAIYLILTVSLSLLVSFIENRCKPY